MVHTSNDSNNATIYAPDSTSPLFIHSSDIPGPCFVGTPFSGSGYGGWKRGMTVSLSAKNKIGLVDGSCPKPSSDDNPAKIRQWDRVNNMVISWLTSSISPTIAESVQYSETAESIWKQLERRYGTVNGTKIFEIKKELASIQQGSLDIASYFNKLKKSWDELGAIRKSHGKECTCAAKSGIEKDDEEDKRHQFLMDLNDVYVGVRSNMLMMHPLPSLDDAYNILLQDENQRQVHFTPMLNPDSASFNANLNTKPNFNTRSPQPPYQPPIPPRQYNQKVDFNLTCRYCKKPGHTIDRCYKLHGYPQNHKFFKGRKVAANVSGDVESPDPLQR
ncbi:uncharacterized protein LOC132627217 [Lycium barbarum]|uniref:uncharacterized protein LOC132627217 n=1 Tax=Lycium barbarum TaxID=112863 RepID=UPI00293E941C|nr:uncharacterized protein LOC132627217 [Lycium barbarum]